MPKSKSKPIKFRCQSCKAVVKTTVLDGRQGGEYPRRRRKCLECGHRFTTYEIPERDLRKLWHLAEKEPADGR